MSCTRARARARAIVDLSRVQSLENWARYTILQAGVFTESYAATRSAGEVVAVARYEGEWGWNSQWRLVVGGNEYEGTWSVIVGVWLKNLSESNYQDVRHLIISSIAMGVLSLPTASPLTIPLTYAGTN